MVLNLLCIILSFPVITMGASVSAMYAVLMKMVHKETVPVFRTFFKNWKDNFLKATAMELIFFLTAFIAYADVKFALTFEGSMRSLFIVVATIVAMVGLIIMTLGILQLSTYENTLKNYIKNSFLLAACAPGWLILSWAVWLIPIAAILFFYDIAVVQYGFILIMWGVSAPAYATAFFASKIFAKVENAQQA